MLKTRESHDYWLLAILALLVLGSGLGLGNQWPADEARFAPAAKQMVDSGDWLFPHRGSELYSDKLPILMWLQAPFYSATGNLRIGILLPSLLAALGTLWCVVELGRRLWTRRVGVYAGWALVFALAWHRVRHGVRAMLGMPGGTWVLYGLLAYRCSIHPVRPAR